MFWDRTTLPWLPIASNNFREQLNSISAQEDNVGLKLQQLASCQLDTNKLTLLVNAVKKIKKNKKKFSPLTSLKVALLGDGSHELINDALVGTALRYGVDLEVIEIPFGSVESIVLDPASALNVQKPDVVILNFTYHAFKHLADSSFEDSYISQEIVKEGIERIKVIINAIEKEIKASIILQTIPRPSSSLFGSMDRLLAGTTFSILHAINQAIVELSISPRLLLDIATLAENIGLDQWHDAQQWYNFKLPFAQHIVPLYADHVMRTLNAMRGMSRKCLVLDLDNTLWGGVIGDDGLENIRLGQGMADGEAFIEIQKTAKNLRARGIILAVASKNNDEIARSPFREHPDMILCEKDISVFQANWTDKAQNLRAIANKLDIGINSFVFLDDNSAERALIRKELPEVAVPELPEDPALYVQTLMAAGYFDVISYTNEDSKRAEMYDARAAIAELKETATDMDSFLASLEMSILFSPFDGIGRTRVAQLVNKSNQFNLTTRRYSEAQIKAMEEDQSIITLQIRLKDKFADHGLISVIICRSLEENIWEIDTWVMSCRVLGRRIEEAVLAKIIECVHEKNGKKIIGRYIRTERNSMVENHYEKLGFSQKSKESNETTWFLDVGDDL